MGINTGKNLVTNIVIKLVLKIVKSMYFLSQPVKSRIYRALTYLRPCIECNV